jgi:hypothetical protein
LGSEKLFDEATFIQLGDLLLGGQDGERLNNFSHALREINERWDKKPKPGKAKAKKATV